MAGQGDNRETWGSGGMKTIDLFKVYKPYDKFEITLFTKRTELLKAFFEHLTTAKADKGRFKVEHWPVATWKRIKP